MSRISIFLCAREGYMHDSVEMMCYLGAQWPCIPCVRACLQCCLPWESSLPFCDL